MMRAGGNGVPSASVQQLLFVLRSANMHLSTDQKFTQTFSGTNYKITNVCAVIKTGGADNSCAGGIYTAASKGGDALVANTQAWSTLAANVMVNATLAAVAGTAIESATPYLSLTTISNAACTADIFIFGFCID